METRRGQFHPVETSGAPLEGRVAAPRYDIHIGVQFRLFIQKGKKSAEIRRWETGKRLVFLQRQHRQMCIRRQVEVSGKPENAFANFYGNRLHCSVKPSEPTKQIQTFLSFHMNCSEMTVLSISENYPFCLDLCTGFAFIVASQKHVG